MNARSKFRRNRLLFLLANLGLAGVAIVMTAPGLSAQSGTPDVYSVEEDWQVVIGDPQFNDNGPQITCTISPADMGTAYCAFDLNYHTQPDYQPGGMQLHTWDPTDPIEFANSPHNALMQTSGETVTWTTRMSCNNGTLNFRVDNGQSQTWGQFDHGASNLALSLPTSLANLNSYSPDVSLDNSGVSFASNLVVSQTLMAVRWYDASGNLIKEITTPQVVHPQQ
jgi:hypothetical protein